MGEITKLILKGQYCAACCESMDDGYAPGFVRYHEGCKPDPEPTAITPEPPQ